MIVQTTHNTVGQKHLNERYVCKNQIHRLPIFPFEADFENLCTLAISSVMIDRDQNDRRIIIFSGYSEKRKLVLNRFVFFTADQYNM